MLSYHAARPQQGRSQVLASLAAARLAPCCLPGSAAEVGRPQPQRWGTVACAAVAAVVVAPRRRFSTRGRVERASTAGDAASSGASAAIALLQERHRVEARRCWGEDGEGLGPGFIMEAASCRYHYDPRLQQYVRSEEPATPRSQQPWRRLPGGASAASDDQAHDGDLALRLLKGEGPDALPCGGSVADVGCGEGFMARHFVRSGQFDVVFALDLSWDQMQRAREQAEEERLPPEQGPWLLHCDAAQLPFECGALDCAWWGQGAHLVPDPGAVFRGLFLALRPGGRLLASTMAECFGGAELRSLVADAGFEDVKLQRSARRTIYTLSAVRP
mmetsp:Transcript_79955/g.177423  ORF Transcript_79955/g.177423 Transcript_79955/m.177423 type:complete len:331 (+) Transcript_79955:48-1040(+)